MTAYNGWSLTWQGGRQLAGMSKTGTTLAYTYNEAGLRTAKTVTENGSSTTHSYTWLGGRLAADVTAAYGLYFHYDQNGDAIGFTHKTANTTAEYSYVKNLQGDVLAILDSDGAAVVSYTYDAWGAPLSATGDLAAVNPLRYRGYLYDGETGLYYVSSRYYAPETCQFINADGQLNTSLGLLGCNMFAYCLNNPVNKVDYGGNKPGDLLDTVDEAALDFAMCYNELSIADMQEYGSAIYKKTVTETRTTTYINPNVFGNNNLSWLWNAIFNGGATKTVTTKVRVAKYYYTEPNIGKNGNSVTPKFLLTKLPVSAVHTHANYDSKYDNENFSTGFASDIGWSNFFHANSYVVTPGGFLKKYTYANRNDASGGVSIVSGDIPWDPNSPNH